MNVELNFSIEDALAAACTQESLQPIIDKAVKNAVESAIRDATGYRSEFAKALEAQLAEAIPHGLHIADVAKFQHIFNAKLGELVGALNGTTVAAAFESIGEQLAFSKPEISLREFIELARTSAFHLDPEESFHATLEESDSSDGYYTIELNREPLANVRYSSPAYKISVAADGNVYAIHNHDRKREDGKFPTTITEFEGALLSLYTGRAKLVRDCDEDDVADIARGSEED